MPQRIGKTLGTTDPPRHTQARKLVNKAFTPRTVAVLEPTIRAHARPLAAHAAGAGHRSSTSTTSPRRSTPTSSGPCSA